MVGPLMLSFVSTLALAIQFFIFVYLYSSHRVRFFLYLLWAWGFFTLSKGLKLVETVLPIGPLGDALISVAGVAALACVVAAALAYRWDYRVRRRDGLGAVLVALGAALANQWAPEIDRSLALILGVVQVEAGMLFWPRPSQGMSHRGAGLLATSLVLWGLHRFVTNLIAYAPGTTAYLVVHGTFLLLYFLTTFAIIIMVLDRARAEMRALKEFNERLVDGLREGLELVSGDFTIRHANRWMLNQFGRLRGRRCYEVLTADGQRCPGCPMERRDTMEGPVRLEITGVSGRRFLLSCSSVRQPNGETLLLELVSDVTEQVQLRERLTAAERLAAAGELAAGVAHEIRNPLAAIVNATKLFDGAEALTVEERANTLDAVRREARRLNRILSDFLIFARPGASRRTPGDIRHVVEHVAALIRDDPARASQVELSVRVDPSVPTFAFDLDQLTQVLWNIALNGVEAMDGGGRLFLEVGRRNGQVLIAVSDSGPGIAREEQARVFEPFYSRKPGGTGLGLTIAQRIIAAHGGRIDVESVPGRGTRFTIALPIVTA
jgi:signal transduction histidine kinase